eukprot:s110_g6.t1
MCFFTTSLQKGYSETLFKRYFSENVCDNPPIGRPSTVEGGDATVRLANTSRDAACSPMSQSTDWTTRPPLHCPHLRCYDVGPIWRISCMKSMPQVELRAEFS